MNNFEFFTVDNYPRDGFLALDVELFINENYRGLSLEAKSIYAFLKRRFFLSVKTSLKDDRGNVYVIATREELGTFFSLSIPTVRKAIKELVNHNLIREEACKGFNRTRKIYLGIIHKEGNSSEKALRVNESLYDDKCNRYGVNTQENHSTQSGYTDLDSYFMSRYS
ncbi:MAG: replication initiator protein A [Sarcina sp.]